MRFFRGGPGSSIARALGVVILVLLMASAAFATSAGVPVAPEKVPVLIVDPGLGDAYYYGTHWLGKEQPVAADGAVRLVTSSAPTWWGGPGAPDTYVLTSSDASASVGAAPITTTQIVWALDQLALRHPEGKAILVTQGAAGLQARVYLEDLSEPKQSSRADVVGLVMLGVPNNGLALPTAYPNLDVWDPMAAGVGLTRDDLRADSAFMTSLNAGRLPSVVKSLSVEGFTAKLAGQDTDGVTVRGESVLASSVAGGPSDVVQIKARSSQSWPLRDTWYAATRRGGAQVNFVEQGEPEKFAASSGYVTAEESRRLVRTFYETWFSKGAPITHVSTRLVIDVSGSMNEKLGSETKIVAAKRAGTDFVAAYASRQSVPGAVPEDLGLVTFNTKASVAAGPGVDAAVVTKKIKELKARDNTDVGKAFEVAVGSFDDSPKAADRVLVFLSDGVNTAGLDGKAILAGPVAKAAKSGIRIDTIALGGLGSADVGFLKNIAKQTGGQFRQSKDAFELRRDFMRARYASLGELTVDSEASIATSPTVALGSVPDGTRLLEIGAVPDKGAPKWELRLNGKPVAEKSYTLTTTPDGVTSVVVSQPRAGAYDLHVTDAGGATRAHVFAVTQVDAFKRTTTAAPPDDTAYLMLLGLGVVGLAAVGGTVAVGITGRRKRLHREESTATHVIDGGGE